METPTVELEGCRAAHERLAAAIADVNDAVVRQPSLLPGRTVAHVLTHLARNAEAVRRIEAVTAGEVIGQYVGGAEGRAAEIEAGARRPPGELINDVVSWSQHLDATFASLPDDCWARSVRAVNGDEHPVALLPFRRWREVEGPSRRPRDWLYASRLVAGTG